MATVVKIEDASNVLVTSNVRSNARWARVTRKVDKSPLRGNTIIRWIINADSGWSDAAMTKKEAIGKAERYVEPPIWP